MQIDKLCLKLAECHRADEVIKILKKEKIWDNKSCWKPLGGNSNNWGTIGNQQDQALNGLVEILVNSGDAFLINKCLEMGIDPKDVNNAPQNLKDALINLLNIKNGEFTDLTDKELTNLAEGFGGLLSSGDNQRPTYTVFDFGEGQAPEKFEDTFVALSKSNKTEIPFVQGKYCAGGTGSIYYCKEGLKLIISRRNPSINKTVSDKIGFTITRKYPATGNKKTPEVVYLVINDEIPSFDYKPLKILPNKKDPKKLDRDFEYGSYVKMFDYDIGPTLRSLGNIDLYYRLSLLLISPTLPIRIYESRQVKANTEIQNMSGLLKRIQSDRGNNIENNFHEIINIANQNIKVSIYVLTEQASQNSNRWHKDDGIIYSVNGQLNGSHSKRVYSTKRLGYGYINNSIITIVDCSDLDNQTSSDLFMADRQRLRDSEFKKELEEKLFDILSKHDGLIEAEKKRKENSINKQYQNNKSVNDIVQKVLDNKTLKQILNSGLNITIGNTIGTNKKQFIPKKFPSFFDLQKKYPKNDARKIESTRIGNILFETDVANDYLVRNIDPGKIEIKLNGNIIKNGFDWSFIDGDWKLKIDCNPITYSIGSKQELEVSLIDTTNNNTFRNIFWIEIIKKQKPNSNRYPKYPKKPKGQTYNLPIITKLKKADQMYSKLSFTEKSALKIVSGKAGYDYYLNMDNIWLKKEILSKGSNKLEFEKIYETTFSLYGMKMESEDRSNNLPGGISIDDYSECASRDLAPFIIPIVKRISAK